MRIIAHRTNIDGPDIKNENKISNLKKCLNLGFDIEIDIRFIDGDLYLGHDFAENIISKKELINIKDFAWIHCKNLEALSFFKNIDENFNYFWHANDDYTLTSKGYIWTYPGKKLCDNSICVMPELNNELTNLEFLGEINVAGLCTDYPKLIKNLLLIN